MKGPPVLNEKTAQDEKEKVLGEWPDTFYLDKALRKSRGKRDKITRRKALPYI